jgi:hypothetical protein
MRATVTFMSPFPAVPPARWYQHQRDNTSRSAASVRAGRTRARREISAYSLPEDAQASAKISVLTRTGRCGISRRDAIAWQVDPNPCA